MEKGRFKLLAVSLRKKKRKKRDCCQLFTTKLKNTLEPDKNGGMVVGCTQRDCATQSICIKDQEPNIFDE